MTPLQALMKKDRVNFFKDFSTEVVYSGVSDPIKVLETDMIDAVTGVIYKTLIINKDDIGGLDTKQTITMRGVVYGIINDQLSSDYTNCYEIRLTQKGTI